MREVCVTLGHGRFHAEGLGTHWRKTSFLPITVLRQCSTRLHRGLRDLFVLVEFGENEEAKRVDL